MTDRTPSTAHTAATTHAATAPTSSRHRRGRWVLLIVALALLAVPRVILHDLDIIHEGTAVNALFVFGPPIVWIAVVLAARVPRPFLTLLLVGLCYGVFLALGHQLTWNVALADHPPRLGGNLADLDPTAQSVILRSFAVASSLVTGTVVGAVAGLAAWAIRAVISRVQRPR